MIVDAHAHAWRSWPYEARVPDAGTRGSIEMLDAELDANGVDHAILVAAGIGADDLFTDNTDNNAYVAGIARRRPDRYSMVADLDSFWDAAHHASGGADRLLAIIDEFAPQGFAHYVRGEDDGWFSSADADAVFEVAAEHGLFASLHAPRHWQSSVGAAAARHPDVPVLLHHQGHVASDDDLEVLLDLADVDTVHVKVSGFHYLVDDSWRFPFPAAIARLERIHAAFGPSRLVWGSDYPVSPRFGISYRQALEAVRTECDFLSDADRAAILGGNALRLLGRESSE